MEQYRDLYFLFAVDDLPACIRGPYGLAMENPDESPDQIRDIKRLTGELRRLRRENGELLAYRQQMEAVLNNAPVELYLKDREGRYLRINRQFEKIFGVRNEDVVGMLPVDVHDPELAVTTREQDLAVLESGEVVSREEQAHLVIDDLPHTLLTIKFPVYDEAGQIDGLGAIVTDITELKETEQRFRDLVDTIDGIVWEADAKDLRIRYISQQAERLLGYDREQWMQPGFFIETVYADDRQRIVDHISSCLEQKLEKYELEYRVVGSTGQIHWIRCITSVKSKGGEPRWLRGIMIDVSVQKEIEAAIISVEEKFRAIFETAPMALVLHHVDDDRIAALNPGYCRLLDRSQAEIMRLGWQAAAHPDDLQKDLELLQKFKQGEIDDYSLEKRFVRPDGSIVWGYLQICHLSSRDHDRNLYLAVIEDITERKRYEQQIWQQANYDLLTGLPNRNMLQGHLTQLIKRCKRSGEEFALLLVDLDGFKDINDTLGHDKGDELLMQAAARIAAAMRDSDMVARQGGDEFVIVMTDLRQRADIEMIATKIIEEMGLPYLLDDEKVFVSASIGITLYPDDGHGMIDLVRNADQAMYAAKQQGRNCYRYFTRDMQLNAMKRMKMIGEMREALASEQFHLHYQPIVELGSGRVVKTEALIRWQHHRLGTISPADFIPLAEESGLIHDIGAWVIREASARASAWRKQFAADFQITINTSPAQFLHPQDFGRFVQEHIGDPKAVNIEITENLLMTGHSGVFDLLLEFRDAGIQVALDDFGTGYSSLSYLRRFDIDYLKIDRSFIGNLQPDSEDLALCRAIIVMAHTLGIEVIAEGIETEAQRDLLLDIGCDYGQGFHFGKPLPGADFEARFLRDA